MKAILDLGSNKGQNINYFLSLADVVIAVEANPICVQLITQRFYREIEQKRLIVINKAIVPEAGYLDARIHSNKLYVPIDDESSVLGTLVLYGGDKASYQEVNVETTTIMNLISEYVKQDLEIYYIKIDLEGLDEFIVADLINANFLPELVSVEMHSLRPFELLYSTGKYKCFKVVEGWNVYRSIQDSKMRNMMPSHLRQFELHSSGPSWDDLALPCLSQRGIELYFLFSGLGWRDLHAKRECKSKPLFFSLPYLEIVIPIFFKRVRHRVSKCLKVF